MDFPSQMKTNNNFIKSYGNNSSEIIIAINSFKKSLDLKQEYIYNFSKGYDDTRVKSCNHLFNKTFRYALSDAIG